MLCCHICSQLLFNSVIGFAWNTFVIFFLVLIITIWMLDKMQKWTCRVVCPTLAASHESLAHHQNFAGLSSFIASTSENVYLNWFNWFILLLLGLLILIGCMIFLLPYQDATKCLYGTARLWDYLPVEYFI